MIELGGDFADIYYKRHSNKYSSFQEARVVMDDPLHYAAMMAKVGLVDGFVAGATYSTSSVIRAALRCLDIWFQVVLLW